MTLQRSVRLVRPDVALAHPVAAVGPEVLWPGDAAVAGEAVVAVVVTLGPELEEEVRRLFQAGRLHEAYCLDEAGTALLGQAAEAVRREVGGVWLAPGCHGLPLSLIPELVRLADGAEVGVEVLASGMLRPEKSVAGLILKGTGRWPAACAECASAVCPWRGKGVPGCG